MLVFILGWTVRLLPGADTPPVLIKKTDPNEGISKVGVIFDAADVELTVDQFGVPFSLKSSIGLPESVANALEGWRYSPYEKNHGSVPFSVKIHFPIARKITPVTERSLGKFWYPADHEISAAIQRGKTLDDAAAKALQAKLTESEEMEGERISLLAYYATEGARASESNRAARTKLLTWFVQHDPKAAILGSTFALVNSSGSPDADADSAAKLTVLWLEAVKQNPNDSQVILHALNVLRVVNAPKAMGILASYYKKKNATTEWAGAIYGLAAIGVTALDPASGKAMAASDASASTAFAAQARDKLITSTDSKMVLTGLLTLTRAGRSLAANHSLPAAFDPFCPKLLTVTRTFDPETAQSCDTSIKESDDQVALVDYDEKVSRAKLIRKVVPEYLLLAKNSPLTGPVTFSAIVSKTGDVAELGFTSGPFLLYHSALSAVKSWKYSPTQVDGKAMDISTVVTVNYTMQ